MGKDSNIQWCDATWNVARGCDKVDSDCKFCYMYRDSFDGSRYTPNQVVRTKTVFDLPLKVKEPSKIFTCSLTDFFHEAIDSYRNEAWNIIRKCPHHTFQILTKRPERIMRCLPADWGEGWNNVWLGTSIGSQETSDRIWILADDKIKANVKFLSIEPLYGKLDLKKLDTALLCYQWYIIGGESGNDKGKYQYRPCNLDWITEIVKHAQRNSIAVFVKQLGTHLSKELKMSDRHGSNIDEFPSHLRVREFPKSQIMEVD